MSRVDLVKELTARTFRFSRVDGSTIGMLTLKAGGGISGYQHPNENTWGVEAGALVFRNADGEITTRFNDISLQGHTYVLSGEFLPRGPGPWHTLTEIAGPRGGIISELKSELYGDDDPLGYADLRNIDDGYPHTNLRIELINSVLEVFRPPFWLELGSMVGGSAVRVASAVKAQGTATEIVCIDPFTGDANMWAWEQQKKKAHEWQFLRLERGRPTIFDRFLANVTVAGHADIILPISAPSIVGLKLLQRLVSEGRLSFAPTVIYLDSAHEPHETFLELQNCWKLLEPGGVLIGDDWGWAAVRDDVLRFAQTITTNHNARRQLAEHHGKFSNEASILLDKGQWVLVK